MNKQDNNKTRKCNSEYGFTLIEIIIVVALIAIAVSLSGLGLSVIKQSNVESMGYDLATEFRDLKYRSVSDYDKKYELVFTHTGGKYGYKVFSKTGTDPAVEIKSKTYKSDLLILSYNDSLLDYELADMTDPKTVTYTFDKSTGGIVLVNLSGQALTSLPNVGGTAKYRITDATGSNLIELTIVGVTGRVVIDE